MGLPKTSDLLRTLLDQSSDQIYAIDLESGAIFDCNDGACRALGYSRDELLSMRVIDFDPNITAEEWATWVPRWLERPELVLNSSHRRRDGSMFAVEVRNRNVLVDGRHVMISVTRDVTKRKALLAELHETQRQYETLLRHLPGVVYRYAFGPESRVFWLDEKVLEASGYSAQEFRDGSVRLRDIIVPADLPHMTQALTRALSTGETFDITYDVVRRDGERRRARDTGRVVPPDIAGEPPTVEGILYDITDRVEAERLLREAWKDEHERYEFVAAASGQVVYEFDMDRGVMHWGANLRQVLGYVEREHPYTINDWLGRLHPEERERIRTAAFDMAERLGRVDLEYRYRHADGSYRWVWDHALFKRDETGRFILGTGLLQDISQRKELEAQVSSAQRMETIGALAGGVAHDVNNYLTTILGNLGLAMMRLEGMGDWPELEDAREAAAGCAELVRSLLTFARQQDPVRSAVALGEVVRESTRMIQRLVGGEVAFRAEIGRDCEPVLADRVQVQQVLLNLVANARDAIGGKGEIVAGAGCEERQHAETGKRGHFGCLWVADDGPGIPPEIRARVFEPYFTTRPFGGGTGLGLSIVHGIARAHGGWAEVSDSEKGAKLSVYFPV
jgi:PAS domain S-box-containing protein